MRILHVDTGRELRGGQHQLFLLLRGLERQGHEQVLLARQLVRCEWNGPGREPTLPALLNEARRADVIHAHDARAHTLGALCSFGKPLVVSRRVAFPIQGGLPSRWKYSRATHFVAVSNHVLHKLTDAGVNPAKITVVYDSVRWTGDSHPVNEAGGPSGSCDKAGDSPPTCVVAVKTDDPLKCSDLAREACGLANIDLRFSSDLPRDLPGAALFLYLSADEGLGSAILLAMAAKVPVVASRVGGIPELIEHEMSGLLVPNEAAAIAQAIQRVLADQEFARRCRARAYERVEREFRDDIMIRRTEQIYRAITESPLLP